jgi:hypothetical protein
MKNFEAIRYMYPDADFSMVNDDISTIAWRTEGITTPTAEQVATAIAAMEAEETAKAAAKTAAKESAQAKLTALGLSDEEIAAITNN